MDTMLQGVNNFFVVHEITERISHKQRRTLDNKVIDKGPRFQNGLVHKLSHVKVVKYSR